MTALFEMLRLRSGVGTTRVGQDTKGQEEVDLIADGVCSQIFCSPRLASRDSADAFLLHHPHHTEAVGAGKQEGGGAIHSLASRDHSFRCI